MSVQLPAELCWRKYLEDSLLTGKIGQESDGLDGLAKSHLVSEDTIQPASVDGDQPIQADMLVLPHCVLQQKGRLHNGLGLSCLTSSMGKQCKQSNDIIAGVYQMILRMF